MLEVMDGVGPAGQTDLRMIASIYTLRIGFCVAQGQRHA